jgi:plasmid stabilization system protein ParE
MGNRIKIDSAARDEFDEAFAWYAKRSTGAAIGFAAEIDSAIEKLAADPGRFPKTFADCQVCMVQRYPYCVIYYHDGDEIVVVAIAHAKRRPGYWRHRK